MTAPFTSKADFYEGSPYFGGEGGGGPVGLSVTSATPNPLLAGTSVQVTVNGTGFTSMRGSTIYIDDVVCPSTRISMSQLVTQQKITMPGVGSVDICVKDWDEDSQSEVDSNHLTVPVVAAPDTPAPTLVSLTPSTVAYTVATPIQMVGTNFVPGSEVHTLAYPPTQMMYQNAGLIIFDWQPYMLMAGPQDIWVRNPDGDETAHLILTVTP